MGFGFVIILHCIAIFIVASVFAVIGLVITLCISKNKRKRKIFLSITIPYLFLYSLYFFTITGSISVAILKNVDIGIGDTWYAPINKNYKIVMIDEPEKGTIIHNENEDLVTNIIELEYSENTNKIYGKNTNNDFFAINMENNKVQYFPTEQELLNNEGIDSCTFLTTEEFQSKMYRKVAGTAMTVVGILSLIVSILIVYFYCKLILFLFGKFKKLQFNNLMQ
ncbi:MAG: hypothetical protein LBS25_05890 [Candidatus Symbiothrix sp.]|jgi:hypothetical protein|nr:hypothetical protein [Candidatus Symbiothrix sp.]